MPPPGPAQYDAREAWTDECRGQGRQFSGRRAPAVPHTGHQAAILLRTNRKLDEERRKLDARASTDAMSKLACALAPLDEVELNAFLSLALLRETSTVPSERAEDAFSPTYGPPIFRTTMCQRRYLTLLDSLSLDDSAERPRTGGRATSSAS